MAGGVRPHRREPLWARIERNGPKLAVYLAAFVLAWSAAAELVVVLPLAILVWWSNLTHGIETPFRAILGWGFLALVTIGAVWAAFAATRSDRALLARLGAQRVQKGDLVETKHVLHDMSIATGLTYPPPLYVLETRAINAFILGRRPERAVVGVTRGLLKTLTPDEQRAVFANLLTRLQNGDVLVATVVSSLMSPEWVWRKAAVSGAHDGVAEGAAQASRLQGGRAAGGVAFFFVVWMLAAFVTEFLYFAQMQQQILTCEAADAKGMLLLKDPRAMLSALEKILPADNSVPSAAAQLAPLFFAWTGDAYMDERDPETRRIARLREVLGVEGVLEPARDAVAADALEDAPPLPPSAEA